MARGWGVACSSPSPEGSPLSTPWAAKMLTDAQGLAGLENQRAESGRPATLESEGGLSKGSLVRACTCPGLGQTPRCAPRGQTQTAQPEPCPQFQPRSLQGNKVRSLTLAKLTALFKKKKKSVLLRNNKTQCLPSVIYSVQYTAQTY